VCKVAREEGRGNVGGKGRVAAASTARFARSLASSVPLARSLLDFRSLSAFADPVCKVARKEGKQLKIVLRPGRRSWLRRQAF